jgi:hypothetical protein
MSSAGGVITMRGERHTGLILTMARHFAHAFPARIHAGKAHQAMRMTHTPTDAPMH